MVRRLLSRSGNGLDSAASVQAELRDEPALGLADVTRMPLRKLAELDDLLLDATLERLLPAFTGTGDRLWNQGDVAKGDGSEPGT